MHIFIKKISGESLFSCVLITMKLCEIAINYREWLLLLIYQGSFQCDIDLKQQFKKQEILRVRVFLHPSFFNHEEKKKKNEQLLYF